MVTTTAIFGHLSHPQTWEIWLSMTDIQPAHFKDILLKKEKPNKKPNPRTLGSGSLGAAQVCGEGRTWKTDGVETSDPWMEEQEPGEAGRQNGLSPRLRLCGLG